MGIKLNPFTGKLDLVSEEVDNFSYNYIITGSTTTIPENQQMLVYEEITIDGVLNIDGELVIIDLEPLNRIINSAVSETINIDLYELIRLTATGVTTSLSGSVAGSEITITNRSGGDNTLNITVQGVASPTIKDLESWSLTYNGTDYDIT